MASRSVETSGLLSPEQILSALDEDQQKVARQVTGPLAVRAGAGTGKTRAITYRIAYGVATGGYDASNVMAVTFTKRAAQEMRLRLRDLGVPTAQARTFHSAALRQLHYFWPSAVGGYAPQVIERKASLISAAAHRLNIRSDKDAVRDFAAEIEWAKTSMVDADHYPDVVQRIGRAIPADLTATQMASLIDAYEQAKEERGVIDFGDVLLLTAGILEEREDIRRSVQAQYRHFVVDEYQDVSILQQHLLDLWLGDRHDICVVGDVAQTIYSFAGATPRYLVNFAQAHPGARIVELNRDYRSTPQIVAIANRIVQGNGTTRKALAGSVHLVSQCPSGPGVQWNTYSDDVTEAKEVVEQIRHLLASGTQPADIAILFRMNSQSELYENALAEAGISYVMHGGQKFFEREEIRRAMLLLRKLAASQIPVSDGLGYVVADAVRDLGWNENPPQAGGALRDTWDNLNALVELAKEKDSYSLEAFLAELEERSENQTAPVVDGVTLSTLHASKGLEWEAVFLIGLAEGILPVSMAVTPAQKEEERRLLYVGVTRAQKHLYMSWSRSRADGSRRAQRQRSRLLDGIWPLDQGKGSATSSAQRSISPRARKRTLEEEFAHEHGDEAVARFEMLKAWRLEVAHENEVPAFTILTDQTLRDIAAAEPRTLKQLRAIRGIGDRKLELFGGIILRLLKESR